METIKVLSLNCWGLKYLSKDLDARMEALGDLLAQSDYDFIGLQEVWVEKHYLSIKEKVEKVLPHSHRFISNGYLSTGCATFSKYPIVDTLFHRYSFNGYFWDFFHGDWYAGKGVTGLIVKHPKKNIYFFNTHMHANYDFEHRKYRFDECRTLQAYQAAQFIRHVTRPGDPIIFTGDFNHESHELGMVGLKKLVSLRDTFDIAEVKQDKMFTVDAKSNEVYNHPMEPQKRIDFVFVNDFFSCKECKLACQKIPGSKMHYSDHEGVETNLSFHYDKEEVEHSKIEENESIGLLSNLHACMRQGEKISSQLSWTTFSLFALLFCLMIGIPAVMGVDYLLHPSNGFATFVFALQLVVMVFATGYTWELLHMRKKEMHTFKAVASEINVKMLHLKHMNGKKKD